MGHVSCNDEQSGRGHSGETSGDARKQTDIRIRIDYCAEVRDNAQRRDDDLGHARTQRAASGFSNYHRPLKA
jgi:hypothetical protein